MVFEAFAASWNCLRWVLFLALTLHLVWIKLPSEGMLRCDCEVICRLQTTSLHHLDARWLAFRQHILPARHSSPARHALQRSQQISSVQSPVANNTHCGDVLSWLVDHRDALPGQTSWHQCYA